ncbi:hypothetical protein [Paraburkholderia sp. Cpub6]|uniref:hypothetical protein n=1 Tax=Paraburkholderia sp. Cpub6 TaxID=2723094 RepID=UPI00161BABF3|nr:hypothetical protein [Paraburkholderia sp. Cpub6]MBB5461979.1 hypothetical protein [Paraburkholderia sp. Cpub6]
MKNTLEAGIPIYGNLADSHQAQTHDIVIRNGKSMLVITIFFLITGVAAHIAVTPPLF